MARTTRDDLLSHGVTLLLREGYAGTSINAVLAAAGVPKGSFYHHFASKEAFAVEVLEHWFAEQARLLARCAAEANGDHGRALRAYFEALAESYAAEQWQGGCLLGALGQQAAALGPTLRARVQELLARWVAELAALIERAQATGELAPRAPAVGLAGTLVAAWEGAIIRAKLARSRDPLEEVLELLLEA